METSLPVRYTLYMYGVSYRESRVCVTETPGQEDVAL
jgi:hypothetical protein